MWTYDICILQRLMARIEDDISALYRHSNPRAPPLDFKAMRSFQESDLSDLTDQELQLVGNDRNETKETETSIKFGQWHHFTRALEAGWPLFLALRFNRGSDPLSGRKVLINFAAIWSKYGDPPRKDYLDGDKIYPGQIQFHPCTAPFVEISRQSLVAEAVCWRQGGVIPVSFTGVFKTGHTKTTYLLSNVRG